MYFKSTVKYLSVEVVVMSLYILVIPIYTRVLTVEEYGHYALFLSFLSLVAPIISMGTQDYVQQQFFVLKNENFTQLFAAGLIFNGINAFAFYTILLLLYTRVSFDSLFSPYLIGAGLIITIATGIYHQTVAVMQNKSAFRDFFLLSFLVRVLHVILALTFMLTLMFGWESIFWAHVISLGVMLIYYVPKTVSMRGARFTKSLKQYLGKLYRFGRSYFPAYYPMVVFLYIDRFFIHALTDTGELGLYAVAEHIAFIVYVISRAMLYVWRPYFFKTSLNQDNQGHFLRNILAMAGFLLLLLLSIDYVFTKIAAIFLGSYFIEAAHYVLPVGLAYCLLGIYSFFSPMIVKKRLTWQIVASLAVFMTLKAVGNMYFIQAYGMVGAAYNSIVLLLCANVVFMMYFRPASRGAIQA